MFTPFMNSGVEQWDFFRTVAEAIVSTDSTIALSLIILAAAVFSFRRFLKDHTEILANIRKAQEAWEKPTAENIDGLADKLAENTEGSVAKSFDDYLRQVKGKDYGDVFEVYSFNEPARYFNEDSLYLSKVNLETYRAMPGILTGLGILFTFLGLACGIYLSIDGLTANAGMQNIDSIVNALKKLLDGASQAFWTSIAGLATSLVYAYCLNAKHNDAIWQIDSLVRKLREDVPVKSPEDVLEEQLAVGIEEKNTLSRLEEGWEGQMKQMFETLMESYASQNKEQTDRMVESLASIKDGIELMSETQAELLGKTLTSAADVVGEKLGQKIDGMASSFKETADSVGHAVEGLDGMLQQVTGSVREVSDELSGQIAALKTAVDESKKSLTDGMAAVTAEAKELVAEIQDTTEGFRAVSENVNRAAGEIKSAGETTAANLQKGSEEAAAGLKAGAEAAGTILETEIGRTVKEMNSLLGEAERLVTASSAALEAWQSNLAELSDAQTRAQSLLESFDRLAQKMVEATQKVEATSDTLTTNISEQAIRTERMNETINERLAEVLKQSEEVAEQQRTVSASIKQEQALVETHLKDLAESLRSMNHQMRSNLAEADTAISSALNALTTALDNWIGQRQETDRVSKDLLKGVQSEIKRLDGERQAVLDAVRKLSVTAANE